MLKILQSRLQQYVNQELPDIQTAFRKGRGTRDLIPDHLTCIQRNLYAGQKLQLEPDMEQGAGSKLGKEYIGAVYCHPAYLTYMQSTSCKMPGWMNHKLESKFLGEISITSDMQMISL